MKKQVFALLLTITVSLVASNDEGSVGKRPLTFSQRFAQLPENALSGAVSFKGLSTQDQDIQDLNNEIAALKKRLDPENMPDLDETTRKALKDLLGEQTKFLEKETKIPEGQDAADWKDELIFGQKVNEITRVVNGLSSNKLTSAEALKMIATISQGLDDSQNALPKPVITAKKSAVSNSLQATEVKQDVFEPMPSVSVSNPARKIPGLPKAEPGSLEEELGLPKGSLTQDNLPSDSKTVPLPDRASPRPTTPEVTSSPQIPLPSVGEFGLSDLAEKTPEGETDSAKKEISLPEALRSQESILPDGQAATAEVPLPTPVTVPQKEVTLPVVPSQQPPQAPLSQENRDGIAKLIADLEQAKASLTNKAPGTVKQKIVQFLRSSAAVLAGSVKVVVFTSAGAVGGAFVGTFYGAGTAVGATGAEYNPLVTPAVPFVAAAGAAVGAVGGTVVGAVKGAAAALDETFIELSDVRLKASMTQSLKSTVEALITAQTDLLKSTELSAADKKTVKAAVDIPALQSLVTKIGTAQSLTKPADLLREAIKLGVKFEASLPANQRVQIAKNMWKGINNALDDSVKDRSVVVADNLKYFKEQVAVDLFFQGDITDTELDAMKQNFGVSDNVVNAAKQRAKELKTKNPTMTEGMLEAEMKRNLDQVEIAISRKTKGQEFLDSFKKTPKAPTIKKTLFDDTYYGKAINFTRPKLQKTPPSSSGSDVKTSKFKLPWTK